MTDQLNLYAIRGVPMVAPGDNLSATIRDALVINNLVLKDGDILVLAQKIVSKSEDRIVDLNDVKPGQKALDLAAIVDKDPRLVELILAESRCVIRQAPGVLITEHHNGWIMANAGIDASNVLSDDGEDNVLLLPRNPDQVCSKIRDQLSKNPGFKVGVIINDSFGRPWRMGTTGIALGAAGLPSLFDRRGERDLFGRELMTSQQAIADELAAAASLLQGQASEARPIVLIRGLDLKTSGTTQANPASDLIRNTNEDLFR